MVLNGLELDVYIPELKLAFEFNGICHYSPIFGPDKLKQTQYNDHNKYQKCLEQNIDLAIIDMSQHIQINEKTNNKYLDIIVNIIQKRIGDN